MDALPRKPWVVVAAVFHHVDTQRAPFELRGPVTDFWQPAQGEKLKCLPFVFVASDGSGRHAIVISFHDAEGAALAPEVAEIMSLDPITPIWTWRELIELTLNGPGICYMDIVIDGALETRSPIRILPRGGDNAGPGRTH